MKPWKPWKSGIFVKKFLTYLYSDGKKIFGILRGAGKHIVDKKAKAMFFTINSPIPLTLENLQV